MADIELNNISIHFDNVVFIRDLNLQIERGKITTIIGPNGSGKSTVLKTMARILKPQQGTVLLEGKSITQLPTKEVARQLALLPQQMQAPDQLSVLDLVSLGRYPHQGLLKRMNDKDAHIVEQAMIQTDMLQFSHKNMQHLSGGQQQRAWIAMALAQDTPYLLLDEPTTFLDMSHQLEILELLKNLNKTCHKTIVMVLHDVNLAARYSDCLILLDKGTLAAQGSPTEVLTIERLKDIFNIHAKLMTDPITGTPHFIPYILE